MINIFCDKTFIWGTGINEEIFIRELSDYIVDLKQFNIDIESKIAGYIESNPEKKTWRCLKIYKPEKAFALGMQLCVVTPKAKQGIVNWLENNDVVWCTSEEYLDLLKDYILETVNNGCENIDKVQAVGCTEIIQKIYKWKKEKKLPENELKALIKKNSIEYVISYLAKYYKNNISDIQVLLPKTGVSQIKTIGIYADKIYGGGIEKVVELLFGFYL